MSPRLSHLLVFVSLKALTRFDLTGADPFLSSPPSALPQSRFSSGSFTPWSPRVLLYLGFVSRWGFDTEQHRDFPERSDQEGSMSGAGWAAGLWWVQSEVLGSAGNPKMSRCEARSKVHAFFMLCLLSPMGEMPAVTDSHGLRDPNDQRPGKEWTCGNTPDSSSVIQDPHSSSFLITGSHTPFSDSLKKRVTIRDYKHFIQVLPYQRGY